jgi:hypothetical protein
VCYNKYIRNVLGLAFARREMLLGIRGASKCEMMQVSLWIEHYNKDGWRDWSKYQINKSAKIYIYYGIN